MREEPSIWGIYVVVTHQCSQDVVTEVRYHGRMQGADEIESRTSAKKIKSRMRFREAKRLMLLLPGVIAIVLVMLARSNPDSCESVFSCGVYPWLSSAVAFLPGFVSFSVAQWVVILAVFLVVAMLVYYVVQVFRKRGKRLTYLYRLLMSALGILSFALFFYTVLCGLNYYRLTFSESAGYDVEPSTTEELVALCTSLAEGLNESRADIDDGLSAYVHEHGGFNGYAVRSVKEMETLAESYPTLQRPYYSQPKPVTIFAGMMSDADITGMFFAYTVESNVNVQPPFYTIPATMIHELAHQCGYMREDEANFIAYLACAQSGDALMRYSGCSLAYSYAIAALYRDDAEAAQAIEATLSAEVSADRQGNAAFWAEHDGAFRTFAQQANDAYLKANDQPDGTQSYGRVVDLLLAEQRAGK